jgi:hypothetical protein
MYEVSSTSRSVGKKFDMPLTPGFLRVCAALVVLGAVGPRHSLALGEPEAELQEEAQEGVLHSHDLLGRNNHKPMPTGEEAGMVGLQDMALVHTKVL